jgi:hypothetical protein
MEADPEAAIRPLSKNLEKGTEKIKIIDENFFSGF